MPKLLPRPCLICPRLLPLSPSRPPLRAHRLLAKHRPASGPLRGSSSAECSSPSSSGWLHGGSVYCHLLSWAFSACHSPCHHSVTFLCFTAHFPYGKADANSVIRHSGCFISECMSQASRSFSPQPARSCKAPTLQGGPADPATLLHDGSGSGCSLCPGSPHPQLAQPWPHVGVLGLPRQTTTDRAAQRQNLLSYSSRGQKSKVRVLAGWVSSEG